MKHTSYTNIKNLNVFELAFSMLNLSSKSIETYPFPHIIQEEIFDSDFYKELEKFYISNNKFVAHKKKNSANSHYQDLIRGMKDMKH